jgi:8-oxo-dGTP diphosphatase
VSITEVAAAVIERPDGSFLLGRRAPDTFYPGYWEFPGGKVEAGETPRQALVRELREELEIEVLRATPWIVREHVYEHAHVRLHFFRVPEWRGELRDHVHAALEWQTPGATTVAPMLPANAPVLRRWRYRTSTASRTRTIMSPQLTSLEHALQKGLRLIQLRESKLPADQREPFAAAAVALLPPPRARVLIIAMRSWPGRSAPTASTWPASTGKCCAAVRTCRWWPPPATMRRSSGAPSTIDRLRRDRRHQPTASHSGQPGIGWNALARLLENCPLPAYAIGGLSRADLDSARAAGAHGIAAIRAAWV